MLEGINLNPDIHRDILLGKISEQAIQITNLEAAVQQLHFEKVAIQQELERMTEVAKAAEAKLHVPIDVAEDASAIADTAEDDAPAKGRKGARSNSRS